MQFVGAILGGIGGGISAFGTLQSSKAEATALKYNALINEANATSARTRANREEDITRQKIKSLMASQRALYAKAGVDLASGSPLLVLAETAEEGEKEAMTVRWEGDVAVAEQKNQASLNRFYAKKTIKAGKIQAWSQGLQAAGGAASSASSGSSNKTTPAKTSYDSNWAYSKSYYLGRVR